MNSARPKKENPWWALPAMIIGTLIVYFIVHTIDANNNQAKGLYVPENSLTEQILRGEVIAKPAAKTEVKSNDDTGDELLKSVRAQTKGTP